MLSVAALICFILQRTSANAIRDTRRIQKGWAIGITITDNIRSKSNFLSIRQEGGKRRH